MKKINLILFFSCIVLIVLSTGCKKEPALTSGTAGNNKPPVAMAGNDTTIVLPVNSVKLNGSGSFDPDKDIITYKWTKRSGPNTFTISNPDSSIADVTNLVQGLYEFWLTIKDAKGAEVTDIVNVFVQPALTKSCQVNRSEIKINVTEISNMPGQVRWPIMFNMDNKIAVVSIGDYNVASERIINVFDKTTLGWTSSQINSDIFREGWSVVVAGTKMFFAGGLNYNNDLSITTMSRVDIFDIVSNNWSMMNLSEGRAFVNAVVASDKIFFAGGIKSDKSFSDKVDIFDITTNKWSVSKLSGTPRAIAGSAVVDNKIFFCGGASEYVDYTGWGESIGKPVTDIDIYEIINGQWSRASLKFERLGFGLISHNENLYVAGGVYIPFGNVRDDVEIINTGSMQTTLSCTSEGDEFYNKNVTSFNDYLIFYGSKSYTGNIKDRLDLYNTKLNAWSVGLLPAGLFKGGYYTSIVADANKLYMVANNKLYELNFQ